MIRPSAFQKYHFTLLIILKVILAGLFSSEYSQDLFLPFVRSFTSGNLNPWQHYYEAGLNLESFPYHPVMLLVHVPSVFLIQSLGIDYIFLVNIIFKIPLLIADAGIFVLLKKLFPEKTGRILLFYFLNPLVIYSVYMHSQLDIIPVFLLMGSVYGLLKEKKILSAVFLGLALATKTNAVLALPLILFYLIRNSGMQNALSHLLVSLGIFITADLPFLFSEGFSAMVLHNTKQSLIFDSYYEIGNLRILLPVIAVLAVYMHYFNQKKLNRDLLFFYSGVLFTALIFFIYPAPAWYLWMLPFTALFFINSENPVKSLYLFAGLSASYIIFYLFFYIPDYNDLRFLDQNISFKIRDEKLKNLSFTVLESALLGVMYAFYRFGIRSSALYKRSRNIVIGIGGDSGTGKSSLMSDIFALFGPKVLQIEGDGEHKWERGHANWSKFTHLDPKANYIHRQADAVFQLKNNHAIHRSEYDHNTGTFTSPVKVNPKEIIVISGLHPFYLPKMRKITDIKIYLDTDETLRMHWKILRDTAKRGYTREKIIQQIESRRKDAGKYIYPQKNFADLNIHYFPLNSFNPGDESAEIKLGLRLTFDASIHAEGLLSELDTEYEWDYNEDMHTQYIELREEPGSDFAGAARRLILNPEEITCSEPSWAGGYRGLIQLLILLMVSEKMKENDA